MKMIKKFTAGVVTLLGASLVLTACSDSVEPKAAASSDPVKMCVLVSDATSSEALAFKDYYTSYVQSKFDVTFTYSDELADAAAEKAAMEGFISNNCKAVISFSAVDRPAQIQMAEDAGIYYAVATGTLTDEQYEEFKNFSHYVGAIGPNLDIERQTGFDMVKHYVGQGKTNFAIFGAGIPYYVDMHIYRAAGMLTALAEEPSTTYGGAKDFEAILGKIMQDGTIKVDAFSSDVYSLSGYLEKWDFGDATWQANQAAIVSAKPEVVLAAGTGFAVFGAAVSGTDIEIGDIDAYTQENLAALESGTLTYLAGKFSSSIGPIFAATLSAVEGSPIRAEGDTAFALPQGYWVATTVDEFNQFLEADSISNPVYNQENLTPFIGTGATYGEFEEFVSLYTLTYEELAEFINEKAAAGNAG